MYLDNLLYFSHIMHLLTWRKIVHMDRYGGYFNINNDVRVYQFAGVLYTYEICESVSGAKEPVVRFFVIISTVINH